MSVGRMVSRSVMSGKLNFHSPIGALVEWKLTRRLFENLVRLLGDVVARDAASPRHAPPLGRQKAPYVLQALHQLVYKHSVALI